VFVFERQKQVNPLNIKHEMTNPGKRSSKNQDQSVSPVRLGAYLQTLTHEAHFYSGFPKTNLKFKKEVHRQT
jgi:hypothetical protein